VKRGRSDINSSTAGRIDVIRQREYRSYREDGRDEVAIVHEDRRLKIKWAYRRTTGQRVRGRGKETTKKRI
jgi:hypothetical protein